MAEDRESGRRDTQRKPNPLVQDVGSKGKAAFSAVHTYRFVAAHGRKEHALARFRREAVNEILSLPGDVVPVGRTGTE